MNLTILSKFMRKGEEGQVLDIKWFVNNKLFINPFLFNVIILLHLKTQEKFHYMSKW